MAIPRCEVNALWAIMAFVSKSSSLTPSASQWYRYKHIVRKLFYSEAAVLASGALSSPQALSLPPSKEHITTCEAELQRVSILLRSGALDPLPEQDGILTSLIQKTISLRADSFRCNANNAVHLIPRQNSKHIKSLLRKVWDSSDIASTPAPVGDVEMDFLRGLTLVSGSLSNTTTTKDDLALFLYGIRPCLALMASWMERLPRDKKARWVRLRKDMDKLVASLAEKAASLDKTAQGEGTGTSAEKDQVDVDFESAFFESLPGLNRNMNAGPSAASAYYRESASVILIASSILMARSVRRLQGTYESFLDENLRKQVWQIVSSQSLRQDQEYIMNGRCGQEPARSEEFLLSLTASKVMIALAFLHLGVGSSDEVPLGTDTKDNCLTFIVSCVAASLDSICNIFMAENKRSNDVVLFPAQEGESYDFRPTVAMCIESVGNVCTWLSALLSRARHTLSQRPTSSNLHEAVRHLGRHCFQMFIPTIEVAFTCLIQAKQADANSDMSVRSTLAVLRNAIGLVHEANKSGEVAETVPDLSSGNALQASNGTSSMGNSTTNGATDDSDLFGGLDDDAFMNIDLDNLTGQSTQTTNSGSSFQADSAPQTADGQLDIFAKGSIWSLLTDVLDASKVSRIYFSRPVATMLDMDGMLQLNISDLIASPPLTFHHRSRLSDLR